MIDTEQQAAEMAPPLPTLEAFAELGQDKAAVARLYDLLLEDIQPDNLIERLWVRDIAVLTIRSEELRLVQLAVHKALMARTDAEFGAIAGGAQIERRSGATGEASEDRQPSSAICAQVAERAVGLTYSQHLAILNGLAEMESDVRRDRDRIVEQIGTRRRGMVHNALDIILEAVRGGEE